MSTTAEATVQPGATESMVSHSEFNTGQIMPINTEVRNVYIQNIIPEQNNYANQNEISFMIDARDNAWTDINNLELEVTLAVKRKNNATHQSTPYPASTAHPNAFPENNVFHSLWERLEIEINGNPIRSDGNYALKSYIDALTNYDQSEAKIMTEMEGFYLTAKGEAVNAKPTMQMSGSNRVDANDHVHASAMRRQNELVQGSAPFTLLGRLKGDILDQGKQLIPGVSMRVRLTKNKPAFNCRAGDISTETPYLEIQKMEMFVKRTTLQDVVDVAYRKALHARELATYPIHRTTVTQNILPSGTHITMNRLVTGPCPRRVYIAFVDNKSITGDFKKSPYNFESLDIDELWLSYDSKDYPCKHYKTDFTASERSRKNVKAYNEVRKVIMPQEHMEGIPYLTYHRWLNGHTIWTFDFTSDLSGPTGQFYRTVKRAGDITMELRLRKVPVDSNGAKRSISVIIFCEYDSTIEIRPADGQPILDW